MIFDPLNQDTFGIGFPPPDSQTNLTSWSSLKGPMWLLEMSFPSEFVIFMYLGSAAKEVKRFKISFLCSDGKTYYSQPSRHAFKIIGSNTKHEWYSWLTWSKSKSWFGPKSHSAMSIGHHGAIHSFSSVDFPFIVLWNFKGGLCIWAIFVAKVRLNCLWNSLLRSCTTQLLQ